MDFHRFNSISVGDSKITEAYRNFARLQDFCCLGSCPQDDQPPVQGLS